MLVIQTLDGSRYNPFIDNYMVVKTNDYANTQLNEIEQLTEMVENSHDDLVMVETESNGLDLFQFLENIGKVCIHKIESKCGLNYLTVQKSLI